MRVVVGLGNPGREYDKTRHNVGFEALDRLALSLGISITRSQCRALVGEGRVAGERVALLKPQTYMNLSGFSVLDALNWYKIKPEDMLILSDDIDLPVGSLRIRASGGAGTHNGWRSILEQTASRDFPRARIGIGAPPPFMDLKDWVLTRWDKAEQAELTEKSIILCAEAAECFLRSGIQLTMNRYNLHSRPQPSDQDGTKGE